MLFLEHYGVTDPGKVRKNNEDSFLAGEGRDETLFVVADGIGGFEAGEVASQIAIDVLKDLAPSAPLENAIREANRRILAAAKGDERFSNMGTTVVAMRFGGTRREPVAEISHVGDSRAYLLRDGEMKPVTEDHSLVAELVRSGDLTRAQASEHPQKNLITRALGADQEVDVDTVVLPVGAGDRLLLCSDGLSDMVPEAKMQKLLTSSEVPEKAVRALVSAALDAGGLDNVTVVVVDVKEDDPPVEESRRGDTQEMRAIAPAGANAVAPRRREKRSRNNRQGDATQRKHSKSRGVGWSLGLLIRTIAVALLLAAALTPAYIWASSRYFLAFDDEGVVVVYRGLPYAPFGYELNEEVEKTGLQRDDILGAYRGQIDNRELKTEEEVNQVIEALEDQANESPSDPESR